MDPKPLFDNPVMTAAPRPLFGDAPSSKGPAAASGACARPVAPSKEPRALDFAQVKPAPTPAQPKALFEPTAHAAQEQVLLAAKAMQPELFAQHEAQLLLAAQEALPVGRESLQDYAGPLLRKAESLVQDVSRLVREVVQTAPDTLLEQVTQACKEAAAPGLLARLRGAPDLESFRPKLQSAQSLGRQHIQAARELQERLAQSLPRVACRMVVLRAVESSSPGADAALRDALLRKLDLLRSTVAQLELAQGQLAQMLQKLELQDRNCEQLLLSGLGTSSLVQAWTSGR